LVLLANLAHSRFMVLFHCLVRLQLVALSINLTHSGRMVLWARVVHLTDLVLSPL
jgi:hypothetical protein